MPIAEEKKKVKSNNDAPDKEDPESMDSDKDDALDKED